MSMVIRSEQYILHPVLTVPQAELLRALEQLAKQGGWQNKQSLCQVLRWPSQQVSEMVEDLAAGGLIDEVAHTVAISGRSANPTHDGAGHSGKLRRAKFLVISTLGRNTLRDHGARHAGRCQVFGIAPDEDRDRRRWMRRPVSRHGDPHKIALGYRPRRPW